MRLKVEVLMLVVTAAALFAPVHIGCSIIPAQKPELNEANVSKIVFGILEDPFSSILTPIKKITDRGNIRNLTISLSHSEQAVHPALYLAGAYPYEVFYDNSGEIIIVARCFYLKNEILLYTGKASGRKVILTNEKQFPVLLSAKHCKLLETMFPHDRPDPLTEK